MTYDRATLLALLFRGNGCHVWHAVTDLRQKTVWVFILQTVLNRELQEVNEAMAFALYCSQRRRTRGRLVEPHGYMGLM